MKLYDATYSGHAHRVRLMCGLLKLDLDLEPVDMKSGAHKSPEFLELNPFGQVPVLQDADVVIRDSVAIILYLAENYDDDRAFLPTDPIARAHVYEWLATSAGPLYLGPSRARVIKAFGRPGDYEQAVATSHQLLGVMNAHLESRSWLVGDGPTLADVACYSYLAVADEGGVDLVDYPSVRVWLAGSKHSTASCRCRGCRRDSRASRRPPVGGRRPAQSRPSRVRQAVWRGACADFVDEGASSGTRGERVAYSRLTELCRARWLAG